MSQGYLFIKIETILNSSTNFLTIITNLFSELDVDVLEDDSV